MWHTSATPGSEKSVLLRLPTSRIWRVPSDKTLFVQRLHVLAERCPSAKPVVAHMWLLFQYSLRLTSVGNFFIDRGSIKPRFRFFLYLYRYCFLIHPENRLFFFYPPHLLLFHSRNTRQIPWNFSRLTEGNA